MRRAWWCVALLAACGDPTLPSRADSYAFDASGDVFHWPPDRLPVRFYAQQVGNLGFLVQHAIDVWASGFLYGEFSGVLASDSTQADVVVQADSAPDVPPDQGPWVAACGGVTTFPPRDTSNRLTGPPHVRLTVLSGYTAAQIAACLRRTTIHELGHALGILQEAPAADTLEIMHSPPEVALPSDRDRRTMEVLYHTPPTILPPP